MAWSNNYSDVRVERVEEMVDTNPELYLERMEHFIALRKYEQALKECDAYLKFGGNKFIYDTNRQNIKDLMSGKVIVSTPTEKKLIAVAEEVLATKIHATPTSRFFEVASSVGADSLDVFQIIMGIEEEFSIEIPVEKVEIMEKWTLRQIATYIEQKR